jgi:predicted GIY-YIG superfamily endonuclease
MAFFVYILKCNDDSYYVGHTDDIERRVSQHQLKECSGYTATRLPVKVVFVHDFGSRDEALVAERQIKGWSRKKKEALIKEDWATIVALSNAKKRL